MLLSPSILAANFASLGFEVKSAETSGADFLHLDVMDGVFVDNISFGIPVIAALRPLASLRFDVHLMIADPLPYIERFAYAGADIITFHYESYGGRVDASEKIISAIEKIIQCGKLPSMAISPATPPEVLMPYLQRLYMVLVMTVNPGYGGQPFLRETLHKINYLHDVRKKYGYGYLIQADGGINTSNISELAKCGLDVVVAGSAFYGADDRTLAARALKLLD